MLLEDAMLLTHPVMHSLLPKVGHLQVPCLLGAPQFLSLALTRCAWCTSDVAHLLGSRSKVILGLLTIGRWH